MNEYIDQVSNFCFEKFSDKVSSSNSEEYSYSHLPLCVIDAVFSIGVKYEGVTNTVNKFCNYFQIDKHSKSQELTVSDILKKLEPYTIEELAEKIYDNRQRTSTANGILKAEAVNLFLNVLKQYNIETIIDVEKVSDSARFEADIKAIKGQTSGVCLKYFFMLAGNDDLIKPDRMIIRFLETITGQSFSLYNCQLILSGVANSLKEKGLKITPKKLDNLIWQYQREL